MIIKVENQGWSFECTHNGFSTLFSPLLNPFTMGWQRETFESSMIQNSYSMMNPIRCNHMEISDNWLLQKDSQTLKPLLLTISTTNGSIFQPVKISWNPPLNLLGLVTHPSNIYKIKLAHIYIYIYIYIYSYMHPTSREPPEPTTNYHSCFELGLQKLVSKNWVSLQPQFECLAKLSFHCSTFCPIRFTLQCL
jgi:hypothetical protein